MMREWEKSEQNKEPPKLLDSMFELFKGGRDQKGHRIHFGLYEDNGFVRERKATESASTWWRQLCCDELRDLYASEKIDYSNNNAFTGFVNHKPNRTNSTIYLNHIKPALCSEHGGVLIGDEQQHMLKLLDRGVAMAWYFSDPEGDWGNITLEEAREHIRFVANQTPENRKKAVFGYDGMCSRFCRWELERKGRATGGRTEKNNQKQDGKVSHKKRDGVLPGPYRVLAEHYPWFVSRVSRGFLARCTDENIFFHVLAAAFVLGINLDDDPAINRTVLGYLDDHIGSEDDILCFESALSRFCSEKRIAALPDYPPRLNRLLSAVMRGGWDENALRKSIRCWQKDAEHELDTLRNQYLEWLLARIEFEILSKELHRLVHNGGISVEVEVKQEQLSECKLEIDRIKAAADELLNRMVRREQAAAGSGKELSGQDSYTISFDGGWADA